MARFDAKGAVCSTFEPEMWFPISETAAKGSDAMKAKAICGECPLREACLQWAADTNSAIGTWGGVDEWERARMIARGELIRGLAPQAKASRVYKRTDGSSNMANMMRGN